MEKYSEQAATLVEAIKRFNGDEEALFNFECCLSNHFEAWLRKFANTPDGMAYELRWFSRMFDTSEEVQI